MNLLLFNHEFASLSGIKVKMYRIHSAGYHGDLSSNLHVSEFEFSAIN